MEEIIQDNAIQPKNKYKGHCTCAVIPAFNEELVIGSIVLKTLHEVDHVIVVDDGSHDRTAEVAGLAGADVVRYDENQGKAHAIMCGFERAQEIGCTIAVMLDGDGQHHSTDIPRLLAPVISEEADLVIGSRFLDVENDIPRYRQFGQKTLDIATNLSTSSDYKSTDSQSGFRALGQKALENLDFHSEGYSLESDMIAHMSARGLRIAEVPISVRYEVPHKHKKHPLTHGLGVLSRITSVVVYKRPIIFFTIPGVVIVITGLAAGSYAFSEYYITTRFPFVLSMMSAVSLIMGLLLVVSGFILNAIVILVKESKMK